MPPEGGQILPWGAAAEASDTGPKVDKDAVEAVAQAVQEQSNLMSIIFQSNRHVNSTVPFFVLFLLCPLTGDAQPFDLETEIQTKEAHSSARAAKPTSASEGLISLQCKSTRGT